MTKKIEKPMRVTLKSGVVIEGSGDEFQKLIKELGGVKEDDGIHYMSESKGVVTISSMNSVHIKNAIAKQYRDWAQSLTSLSVGDFLSKMRSGPDGATMLALIKELATRELNERSRE